MIVKMLYSKKMLSNLSEKTLFNFPNAPIIIKQTPLSIYFGNLLVDFSHIEYIVDTSTMLKSNFQIKIRSPIFLYISLPTDKKENDLEKKEADEKKVDEQQPPSIKQETQTKAKHNLTMHSLNKYFRDFYRLIYLL